MFKGTLEKARGHGGPSCGADAGGRQLFLVDDHETLRWGRPPTQAGPPSRS